ncbi:MAG: insulinase family protein [Prevotellaceae bacterium]|nr:insulinase family protein [Prevotellaceae bacterium]
MKKKIFNFVLVSVLLLPSVAVFAQPMPPMPPLPLESKIRFGKLDNGLTYYILPNQKPKDRAEFFIAQNVGAILEEDNQDGLAHFLEHMAFNGTKNFPGKGILNYMEKQGVKFGTNINAYTSFDETVYNISDVPTTRAGIIDTALLVLHDWSSFISLEDKEIDAERGVILEERRTRWDANRRLFSKSAAVKYAGSQYAVRDVIGDSAVIATFSYKQLRDYYDKWYRTDLQAIVVVGDVDADKVEAKIKEIFADIKQKANAGERPIYIIPNNQEPIVAVVQDKEARYTTIELEYKQKAMPNDVKLSMAGYAVGIVNQLISTMINNRFEEISLNPKSPVIAGYGGYGSLFKAVDAFYLTDIPKEGQELQGLELLVTEAEKIKRFGFTNSELERAKTDMLKNFEKSYNERNNRQNISFAREIVRNFTQAEPVPGIEWEYNTLKMLLPNLPLEAINMSMPEYITDTNLVISFTAPEKEGVLLPSKEQILAVVAGAKDLQLEAPQEEVSNIPLLETKPKAGTVAPKGEKTNRILGTTEWKLSNGVNVIFKPTEFKKDEILLNAYSQGGLSKVALGDLPAAQLATDVVANNGLGKLNQIELKKALTGKIANVSPVIDKYEEGFKGNSSVNDFETLLQQIYLYFTEPRKDDDAFESLTGMIKTSFANLDKNPRVAFSDSVQAMRANHSKRWLPTAWSTYEKVEQDAALRIFKERFANPADFTFIFTGNINPKDAATRDLILTYLGGLATTAKLETYTDNNIRVPKGEVKNYFQKEMENPNASNFAILTGNIEHNIANRVILSAISDILDIRYTESIREREGGSYGVGTGGGVVHTPVDMAQLIVQFDCNPDMQTRLMEIVFEEIDLIVKEGPKAEDLQKVKENLLKQYAQDVEENSWWNNVLYNYYRNGLNYPASYKTVVEKLSAAQIQSTLKALRDQKNTLQVVMMPKAK